MLRITLFTLITLFSTQLLADTITLSNGDRISGQVVRMDGGKLVFKTTYAGEIKVSWNDIASLKTDKPIRLVLNDDSIIENANITSSTAGAATVTSSKVDGPVKVKLASVKYINPSDETLGKGTKISGRVNVGISVASGNSDTETYNVDAEVVMRSKVNRITVGGNIYQASDNGVDTEDKSLAYLKYDHFMSKKRYIYGTTSFQRDEFRDLKLKSTVGLGYGHQFLEGDTRNLSAEVGFNYVNDDFVVAADDDYIAGRWAIKFDQKFFNKKLQFFHGHEGLVEFDNTDNVVVTSQTGFRFPIFAGMNAALQLNVDWDNEPPAGTKSTDRKFLFNVGYSW